MSSLVMNIGDLGPSTVGGKARSNTAGFCGKDVHSRPQTTSTEAIPRKLSNM